MFVNTRQIGKVGERIAVNFLKSRGYKILHTNWTCYAGEIDIVAYKGRLTFVEVKSAYSGLCSPCEMFNYRKRKNLSRSIKNYLVKEISSKKDFPEWQVDLICISKLNGIFMLDHYKNVM